MKPKAERTVNAPRVASSGCSCNDRRQMPPGFPMLAPVRKEVRGVAVCAAAHIVDGVIGNAAVLELQPNQRSQIAMGFCSTSSNNPAATRSVLDLASNFLADLECLDANVRTDRNNELGGIVRKGFDGARHDPGHRAAPTSVHSADVPTQRMRDQHRYAIGRPCSDPEAFDARNECIAFQVGDRFGDVGLRDLADMSPMDLPLLEQAIARKIETVNEAGAVLAHRVVVIA